MALWDLGGKRAEQPVCALITDVVAPRVAVNASIGAVDRARAAARPRTPRRPGSFA